MQHGEVLIVGGGPAGSACAWKLRQHGVDVVLLDRCDFPRDKVCAGWITPPILQSLQIDVEDYAAGRVFQPFTSFVAGLMGGRSIRTDYGRPVSYGIRRCEFDDYLLRRSGARLELGAAVKSIRNEGTDWIVNETISAPVLIGAGGHFCPVARLLAERDESADEAVVLAQEAEFLLPSEFRDSFPVAGACPEFYFCSDLAGYGWIVRKGDYVNVGLGREQEHHLSTHVQSFVNDLQRLGKLPVPIPVPFHGHAYRLRQPLTAMRVPPGVLLIGDACGLASPQSGEGIRPAIESGLIAADLVLESSGNLSGISFENYATRCAARFGSEPRHEFWQRLIPAPVWNHAARWAMRRPWFHRRILLDRWFLHRQQPAL